MAHFAAWALGVGLAIAIAAIVSLTRALRRESQRRTAAEMGLALRAERIAMLDRRLAAIAPLDALWLGWQRGSRPPREAVTMARVGLGETRLLFIETLAPEFDTLCDLLLAYERHLAEADQGFDDRRQWAREEALEREIALEQALKPRLASLRARLAEAARVPDC